MNLTVANPANTAATLYLVTKAAKQITWTPRRDGDLFYMFDESISDNPNYETQEYESFGSALIIADKTSTASQVTVSVEYRSTFAKLAGTPFILTVSYTAAKPASIDDVAVPPATTGAVTTDVNDYTVATSAQDTLPFPFDVTPVPALSGTYGYYYNNGPSMGARLIAPNWNSSSTMLTLASDGIPSATTVQLFATFVVRTSTSPILNSHVMTANATTFTRLMTTFNSDENMYYATYTLASSEVFPILCMVKDNTDTAVAFSTRLSDVFLFF